jgi:OFA family oxalate/formate antiporter-like MFS transporter
MVLASGVLVATAWMINAFADSLTLFYVAAVIAGLGASPIFADAVKWFPDKRGLATGLTVAGFGAGSALTVLPLANLIQARALKQPFCGSASARLRHHRCPCLRAPRASDHMAVLCLA